MEGLQAQVRELGLKLEAAGHAEEGLVSELKKKLQAKCLKLSELLVESEQQRIEWEKQVADANHVATSSQSKVNGLTVSNQKLELEVEEILRENRALSSNVELLESQKASIAANLESMRKTGHEAMLDMENRIKGECWTYPSLGPDLLPTT